jgi:hypothetical protein
MVNQLNQQPPADPNLIVNRFKPNVPAKPNRSDPAWNAVTDQVKDWQRQHSFSYTNYGYAANKAASPPVEKAQNSFMY